MSILDTDDFNRADNTSLGSDWQETGAASWGIVSNRVRMVSGGLAAPILNELIGNILDVKATCTQHLTTGDGGPCVRWFTGTFNTTAHGYVLDCYSGHLEVYRHDTTNTGVLVGSGALITSVADAVIALEVSGSGASVTLKSYHNGVLKETIGDANANRITTAQRCGILGYSGGVDGDYDDFIGDDLLTAGAAALTELNVMPLQQRVA